MISLPLTMHQLDLFEDTANDPASRGLHTIRDGAYYFQPDFFNTAESDTFFTSLKEQIQWKQESMQLYGKQVNFPRLSAWYGEKGTTYTFSGVTHHPHPWTVDLIDINKRNIEGNSGIHSPSHCALHICQICISISAEL